MNEAVRCPVVSVAPWSQVRNEPNGAHTLGGCLKILGLDFETNSDDAKTCAVTEVGAILMERVLHELGHYVFCGRQKLSQLVWQKGYPEQSQKIIEITGITDAMLQEGGKPVRGVFQDELFPLMEQADYILAHNKAFDQTVLESVCKRIGLTPPKRRWICTLTEVPYPEKYRCKQLSHLALDHKLSMDTRELHRAVNDVELMLELICTKYQFDDILAYADMPWVYLQIHTTPPWEDGGKTTDEAKKLGYYWQTDKRWNDANLVFNKCWVKRVKLDQLEKEKSSTKMLVSVLKS